MIPVDIKSWPDWLLDLLHVDPGEIPDQARAVVSLERFPESEWGLLALVAIVAGFAYITWIYRKERSLPAGRKAILAALRCLVLLAVALTLFHPVLEISVERDQKAVTLVLVDDSLSFGIADRYPTDPELREAVADAIDVDSGELGSLSRAEIAERLLGDADTRFLPRLAERNLVKVYTFSDDLREAGAGGEEDDDAEVPRENGSPSAGNAPGEEAEVTIPRVEITPRGTVTDVGGAIRKAVEKQGSTPVAAVVIITDGKRTTGEDPVGTGLFLAGKKIPVVAVGIGDPSETKNIRVTAVASPERVFLGDPLAIDVGLDHRGFAGETVTVELRSGGVSDGGSGEDAGEVLDTMEVTLGEASEASARFTTHLGVVGRQRLLARIEPREGETFDNDNERATVVEVVDQATRVLVVSGSPSSEFRMLRNLLRRDSRVHVAAWLMSADVDSPQEGNTVLTKLPASRKDLFEYDVVILMDVDPEGFPVGFPELLEVFVGKHRGGLAFVAGEKYSGRTLRSPALAVLRDLIAVEADGSALDAEFGRGQFFLKEWPLVPTLEAAAHAVTRLSTHPDRNRELWGELAGIYWSFPVKRAKPGATVLLEHPDPRHGVGEMRRPLLAYQFYGGGRTLFMGFDESWRWRALSEEIYDRYWLQVVRTLAEGRLLGDRRQLILTDRDSYHLGDVMRISALVQDEDYLPSTAERIEVEVQAGEGKVEKLDLERIPGQDGWYRGVTMPAGQGSHRIRIPGGAEKVVSVEIPRWEYRDPRLDEGTLRVLADATADFGGAQVPLKEFAEIPERIPDRSQKVVMTDEPRPLWDNAITLFLVVGLLASEWITRKWNRLP